MTDDFVEQLVKCIDGFPPVRNQAKALRDMMLVNPEAGFHSERLANVSAVEGSDFDFEVETVGRRIYAYYSEFLSLKGNRSVPHGRYQFLLRLTDPRATEQFVIEPLVTVEFPRNGEFSVGGDELVCDPGDYDRPRARSILLYHLMHAIIKAQSED